ncbi:hypothetical protein SAMN05216328_12084 [Ensifer sp. YR511]|nr:hypothetical protein SAMN05216328_12084 [Ensifer sp. YR511]
MPQSVRPTLVDELPVGVPDFDTEKGVVGPSFRLVYVQLRWHHVVIAGKDNRDIYFEQFRGIGR